MGSDSTGLEDLRLGPGAKSIDSRLIFRDWRVPVLGQHRFCPHGPIKLRHTIDTFIEVVHHGQRLGLGEFVVGERIDLSSREQVAEHLEWSWHGEWFKPES